VLPLGRKNGTSSGVKEFSLNWRDGGGAPIDRSVLEPRLFPIELVVNVEDVVGHIGGSEDAFHKLRIKER
jgi:hypothetical protein